jgi:cytochrome b561
MGIRNDAAGWGWPARLLHWAIAALILFQLGSGFWMVNGLEDLYARFALTQTHKSWGTVVFLLAIARVSWRMANPVAPRPPAGTERWERIGAALSHGLLYALILILPVSGWLMASASELQEMYGVRNMVFGWVEMPDPFAPGDAALEAVFRTIHVGAAILLALTLLAHVGAALRHHLVLRDDVMRRMIRGG